MKKLTHFFLLTVFVTAPVFAQSEKSKSRFSHKGIKVSFGVGGFENEFETFGGKIEEGEAASLSLGWGVSEFVTLWLTGMGIEHPGAPVNRNQSGFGGVEFNIQYKFSPRTRLQPYGKLGVGIYEIDEAGVGFLGGGPGIALGADYFFSRNVGIGVEVQFKGQEYSTRSVNIAGQKIETKLNPKLEGKSSGILLTLTLQ